MLLGTSTEERVSQAATHLLSEPYQSRVSGRLFTWSNLGNTELRFRIPGQERIYCHKIEIIENDGVPSILGVDFLKSVGATPQFTEHCDTATWSTPGHDTVTIPLHCTAPEVTGSYAVTAAEGFILRPGQEVKRCVTHIDIAPERLRFNQSPWITPTVVTVESNNSEADDDSLDLIPTTCVRHCVVSPALAAPTRWQAGCHDHSVCQEQHCIRYGHITRYHNR